MKTKILIAGATDSLGGMIISELLKKDVEVVAIVRRESNKDKIQQLEALGATVVTVNMMDVQELTHACEGVSCVISVLQGLRDVIIDVQSALLQAAINAHVPRFIPSDYSTDYTQVPVGENRNFDLRREFMQIVDKTSISATTIFNGAFAEILRYGTPLINFEKKTIGYWENPDWYIDFTTMGNTALFAAEVALDAEAPRIVRCASFQVTAHNMAFIASNVMGQKFEVVNMGSLDDLAAYSKYLRMQQPEGEHEVFPDWQRSQYIHSMFKAHNATIDNARYPDITWTSLEKFLTSSQGN